jgi:6-phosphogluconolactonase
VPQVFAVIFLCFSTLVLFQNCGSGFEIATSNSSQGGGVPPIGPDPGPGMTLLYSVNANQIHYVPGDTTNSISVFLVNRVNGSLSPLAGGPYQLPSGFRNPYYLAIDVDRKILTTVTTFPAAILSFRIASSGALEFASSLLLPMDSLPTFIVQHPSQPVVYVALAIGHAVAGFRYDNRGVLRPINTFQTYPRDPGATFPHGLALDPTGRWLFSANSFEELPDRVFSYAVNGTDGSLTAGVNVANSARGSAPRNLVVNSSGTRIYAVNEDSPTVGIFRVLPSGLVQDAQLSPEVRIAERSYGGGIAITTDDRFLYATHRIIGSGIGWVSRFSVNPTDGGLGAPKIFETASYPQSLEMYPNRFSKQVGVRPKARFLYTGNSLANSISAFSIDDATGDLTPISARDVVSCVAPCGVRSLGIIDLPGN